jgi:hypothetical protein
MEVCTVCWWQFEYRKFTHPQRSEAARMLVLAKNPSLQKAVGPLWRLEFPNTKASP